MKEIPWQKEKKWLKEKVKRNTMATSQLVTDTKKFDGMIVDVITDLRKKHKRADCESIHKDLMKESILS